MTPEEKVKQAEQEFNTALNNLALFLFKLVFWYLIFPTILGVILMHTWLDGRHDPVMAPVFIWWILRLSYDILKRR